MSEVFLLFNILSTHRHLVLAYYNNTTDIILMISLGEEEIINGGWYEATVSAWNVYEILYSVTVCGLSRVN